MKKQIPLALVALRVLIALILLGDGLDRKTGSFFVIAFLVAFFSDIFDGILARRWGVSNATLRQWDSWADVCLYAAVLVSFWRVFPDVAIAYRLPLLAIGLAQLLWVLVGLVKFGRTASFHTYSAKLWGISLAIAIVLLFGFGSAAGLGVAIAIGIVHSLEEIGMMLVLPKWQHDVLSIFHAIKRQKAEGRGQEAQPNP
ncbi:MAG: CDP-diacylglycerol--glycerol-3-phosphate 3-phosphatidyltransferase [Leptolyngbyaceae cyanobacterium SM1_3_5]|nr:CDP-diacylglycerol--glycerol-3-phosphate 3-phosphatidyltransferase [Leptolyngbyaceae cyanobacterium SM1_3_5]